MFDRSYFLAYKKIATEVLPYHRCWQDFSFLPTALNSLSTLDQPVRQILILGSATGEPLEYCQMQGFKVFGIEISSWAQKNCIDNVDKFTYWGDCRVELPNLIKLGHRWDLVYSGCLQYCSADEVDLILSQIRASTKYFCHFGGFLGFEEMPDPNATLNKPFKWWTDKICKQGFKETDNPYIYSA